MKDKLENLCKDLKIDSKRGKFLADKSFKYDVLYFMANRIKNNALDGFYNYNSQNEKKLVMNYTVLKIGLNSNSDGILNFMNESINLLIFSNVLKESYNGVYQIINDDVLTFICESMENAYIFQYILTYYSFLNDGILDLYCLYVDAEKIDKKKYLLNIYREICRLSPSIGRPNTAWSKLCTKYPIMVLGLANDEFEITRELNIKDNGINPFSLSANKIGTKTIDKTIKNNNYSAKFNLNYVKNFLAELLVRRP